MKEENEKYLVNQSRLESFEKIEKSLKSQFVLQQEKTKTLENRLMRIELESSNQANK